MTDFQVGDVVVCVDDSPCTALPYPGAPWRFPLGRIAAVQEIDYDEDGAQYLGFDPFCDEFSPLHDSTRFRKIEAADEQFTQQMRALRPIETVAQSPDPSPSIGDR